MYVCVCNAVTEGQIHASVARGSRTLDDLQFDLGVATCCGCCAQMASGYLPDAVATAPETRAHRCDSATVAACAGSGRSTGPSRVESPATVVVWRSLSMTQPA